MAVQLENLRSEIKNFNPEAHDENITSAVAGATAAVGAEQWNQLGGLLQHPLAIVHFFKGSLTPEIVTAVLANDNDLLVGAFTDLVPNEALTAEVLSYVRDRVALYTANNTDHALHAGT